MSVIKKFNELTSEQQEAFNEIKSVEALDKFIADNNINLTDGEKSSVVVYLETGMMPLDDDDMDAVTGGKGGNTQTPEQKAAAEGRKFLVRVYFTSITDGARCDCNKKGTIYAAVDEGFQTFHQNGKNLNGRLYRNAKCYNCNLTASICRVPEDYPYVAYFYHV